MPQSQLDNLFVHLEEIIREERKTPKPLYKFVDTGVMGQLMSNRNHVILGRRGSGKSVLLRELEIRCSTSSTIQPILVDIESVAQKSYPNLIVEILLVIFREMVKTLNSGINKYNIFNPSQRKLAKDLENAINELDLIYNQGADEVKQKKLVRQKKESTSGIEPAIANVQGIMKLAASLSKSNSYEITLEQEETKSRLSLLFNSIRDYKDLINRFLKEVGDKTLFLLVDDFYQIDLFFQPLIADYMKRLFYKVPCFLKIATVRNRSLLFVKDNLTEAGIQAHHDYTNIDLDYSLDDFGKARRLLSSILQNTCEGRIDPSSLFAKNHGGVMDVMTEASGGNPRDFINLLRNIVDIKRQEGAKAIISDCDVRSAITEYYKSVRDETATTYQNFAVLDVFLKDITHLCQDSDDIGFYIPKKELKKFPSVATLLGQLADSRFIHLLSPSYNPPNATEDNPAMVYLLSMGIYLDYVVDKTISVIKRQTSQSKAFPKLLPSNLASKLAKMAPELELLGKTTSE